MSFWWYFKLAIQKLVNPKNVKKMENLDNHKIEQIEKIYSEQTEKPYIDEKFEPMKYNALVKSKMLDLKSPTELN